MKEEYFVRENCKFESIMEETKNGLIYDNRQVFKLTTYFPNERHFYLGIRGEDYLYGKQWNWKELPLETFIN